MIPTTAAGILVLVLAVLPGIPGDRVYRALSGVSVREAPLEYTLRLVTFSVLGLAVYAFVALRNGLPSPGYVIPSNFTGQALRVNLLPAFGMAYLGHFAASAIVGTVTAGIKHLLNRVQTVSANRDAWDHFVNHCVPQRWAALTLQNGETYVGIIEHADITLDPNHRDLVLAEPARLDPERGYVSLTHQHLFLRGSEVVSVCTIGNPDDHRLTTPGSVLFDGGNLEAPEISEAQSANAKEIHAGRTSEKSAGQEVFVSAGKAGEATRRSSPRSTSGEDEQKEVDGRQHQAHGIRGDGSEKVGREAPPDA